MNQLQAIAMNEGKRRKTKLWSKQGRAELENLVLAPWASRRRQELLELLDRMDPVIEELTKAAEHEARKRPEAARLMTHRLLSIKLCLTDKSWALLKTRLKHGIELRKSRGDGACHGSPATLLQR
jgi:hypothetical protein